MFLKVFQEADKNRSRKTTAPPSDPTTILFDDWPDAYYQADLKGTVTYANTALYKIREGSAESLLGQNFRRFATQRTARKALEISYGVYCTGNPGRMADFETTLENGKRKNLDISMSLLRDSKGEPVGFQGIVIDRTEDRNSNSDLSRYRDFVESIEDGCFEVDLDGTMVFINEAMCKIHGYSSQELLGMNHRSFASREDAKNIYKTFHQVYRTGKPSKILDYTIIHKDGSPRYLEVSASLIRDAKGHPVGFRGITRDRTEKRMKELELERYREFIENVEDACYEVDLHGNMTFFNRATVKNFGYPADRLIGLNNRVYTTPEEAKRIYAIYHQIYKTGRPAKISNYEIIGSDGLKRYLDTTASLITDTKGNAIGFRGVSRDVTEQHHVAYNNARLTEMLNQIQRLEAIGTLAAGVAHNFNNLLMSIQGYVTLIEMDTGDNSPNRERIRIIQSKIQKGSQLTTQLLNYADSDKQRTAPADIKKIVLEVASRFRNNPKAVHLIERFGENLPLVVIDRHQIEHVLSNLLTNAEQAMPDGGSIEIGVEKVALTEEFARRHKRQPGAYLLIHVSDTGMGMDSETRQHIFEPFFTTKKNALGAGLGLSSVYGIIKSHRGIIEVESETGKGTTFSIYLPLPGETAAKSSGRTETAFSTRESKTVLLVDDEKVGLEMMSNWLRRKNFHVITAQSGEEALKIYHAQYEKIDLIIMDVVMPGISGDEALARMGNINPDVKAILISGFIDGSQEEGIIYNERQTFFQKPVDYHSFSEVIEMLLASG